MYDVLLRGGRVVDGTGAPWLHADIGIIGDRIAAIGGLDSAEARVTLAVADLVVAPGFVDFHSHSDVSLLADPRAESAIRQGITTQVVGNCGFSAAPVSGEGTAAFRRDGLMFSHAGYAWDWTSTAEYRQRLKHAQIAINVVTLVGHNTLRAAVLGQTDRPASEAELQAMRRLLARALEEGALGLSSGLTYTPGAYASTAELVTLAEVLVGTGLGYHTHMRNYGSGVLASLDEALESAHGGRLPLFVSHLYPAGPENWGSAGSILDWLDRARARGVEVSFDVTPWPRGGGPFVQYLPGWARAGGVDALAERLASPADRARIRSELQTGAAGLQPRWHDELIVRVGHADHRGWVGQSIAEVAESRRQHPADAALDLILEDDGQMWVAPTSKCEDDIELLLRHPLGIPVTDGITVAEDGPTGRPEMQKSFGTFPRVLGHYVRDRGVLSLESAVQNITADPARRLGVWNRGLLRPGMAADITVFDPTLVRDRGDERSGGRYPAGIVYVMVNGQLALTPEGRTSARSGQVL